MTTVADILRAAAAARAYTTAVQNSQKAQVAARAVQGVQTATKAIKNAPVYKAPAPAPAPAKKATPSYSAPAPARSGRSSGGGGDYTGGSSGGFSGGFGGGGDAPPAPVMQDITIADPLASEPYKRAKAEMQRARSDFDAQQALARGQYDTTFDNAQRQLGWRSAVPRTGMRALQLGAGNDEAGFDPNAQGSAYGDAYQANQGDFAGRGLFNSGLYAQALSNMNSQFNDRRNSALTDQKSWRDTQDLNKRSFYGQQDAADAAAQEDAISTIMAQLGVSRDQVTPGRQNVIQRAA